MNASVATESQRREGRERQTERTTPPPEASVFQAGALDPVVALDGKTAAVAICADVGLASHAARARERGVSAYLASMFVIPSEFADDASRLGRYASEHSFCVALANYGSRTGGLAAAGRSSIWSESGELLVEMPPSGAGIAVARRTVDGWRSRVAMV